MGELGPSLTGKVVIDTTTGEPDATTRLSRELAAKGVTYLDATIVGSSQHVRQGNVLVLLGGEEQAFRKWHELFDSFARQVFYLGPSGSGARMKLVVNLVLGLNRAVLAEGLTFASRCGVDPAQALEVLRAGLSYSRVMDTKGDKMVRRDFTVEARLSQHHKDVGLILAIAQCANLDLPLTKVHDQLLSAAELAGYGAADNSAIIAAYK
jgi:3-hydroxyisobutyrate dehydrogenase-like beta-hydroxyacid dehydrogenase